MPEMDFKRIFSSRNIKRALKNMGIMTDTYAHKVFVSPDSIAVILPKICDKYNIFKRTESTEEELLKEALEAKIESTKKTLAEEIKEEDGKVMNRDELPF